MGKERRLHPRWRVDEGIHCYVDGERLDARTLDLSSSGMFLETERDSPAGSNIVLVFRTQFSNADFPVFLVGCIMHRQTDPTPGLGLRWVRASTRGNELQLALFLGQVLRIRDPHIAKKSIGRAAIIHSCFEFDEDLHIEVASQPSVDASPRTLRSASPKREDVRVELVQSEAPKQRAVKFTHDIGKDGPLTQEVVHQDSLAPVDLGGSLELSGKYSHTVRLEYLGLKEAWMVGKNLPVAKGDEVVIRIPVTSPSGRVEVRCTCEVMAASPLDHGMLTALKVWIISCDEGGQEGIFYNYVRWLHFNVIRKP